jgi:hypothetical protein
MAEVRGYSGSIGLMWNRRNIKIHLIKIDFHFLHVQVKEKDMDPWLLTMVYTSPRENKISDTCHQSQILATIITDPWLVMGDFNEIANPVQKKRECQHTSENVILWRSLQ